MAQCDPPADNGSLNVVPLQKRLNRTRVVDAVRAALSDWAPIETDRARQEMIEIDVNVSQILYGLRRADILDFSEDLKNHVVLFTAKLLSAGEDFFVTASVERVAPLAGRHVIIKRVWR